MFKGSWQTTVLGILTILLAISSAGVAILDNDPETKPDWDKILLVLGVGTAGAGGVLSRAEKVSDEQAGAGKK